jgi:hypothetical protein
MSANSVDSDSYVDGSIDTVHIGATQITGAKLNNDVISAQTALASEPADTDEFMVSDGGVLKRIDYSLIKGGGKVGQVIQNVITSGDTASTTTSFIATSHEVTITPSAASSNIFIMFSFNQGTQTDNRFARFRFYRDIGGAGYSHLTNVVAGSS